MAACASRERRHASDTSAGAAPRNGAASSAQAPTSRAAAKDRETTAKLPASTDLRETFVSRHAIEQTRFNGQALRATRLLERREEPLERVRRVGPGRLDGERARRVREHLGAARRVDGFA